MGQIHVLSLAYDDVSKAKTKRSYWRVRDADKCIEEILKNSPDAHVTRMHNDDARYDNFRSHLDGLAKTMGADDIFWFQYNGHGNHFIGYEPIDLLNNWDEKGEFPFVGENALIDRDELLEKIALIKGLKILVMDSCCSDIDIIPPADTIYVAAAESEKTAHGDLSKGIVHPTLSRYSLREIVTNGSYQAWNGLEYEFGEHSIVRANIVSPQFRVVTEHGLPNCRYAQDFYEKMTGEKEKIMMRFTQRPPVDPRFMEYFKKLI